MCATSWLQAGGYTAYQSLICGLHICCMKFHFFRGKAMPRFHPHRSHALPLSLGTAAPPLASLTAGCHRFEMPDRRSVPRIAAGLFGEQRHVLGITPQGHDTGRSREPLREEQRSKWVPRSGSSVGVSCSQSAHGLFHPARTLHVRSSQRRTSLERASGHGAGADRSTPAPALLSAAGAVAMPGCSRPRSRSF